MSARTQSADLVSSQGHYAGSVSRFLAYVIDLGVSTGLFALGLAAVSFVAEVVTGNSIAWNRSNVVVAIIFAVWQVFYFGYSWAASGRSPGMAVLGLRVVRADGAGLDPWRGFLRSLVFPLSFLFFGLGFLGILVQREHRALQDLIAGSAVIYAWDARAARLRFLAREAELGVGGDPQRQASTAGAPR
ncbi:MAG: RDD family protein [Streptosporangiaceae bacterium]